MAKSLEGKPRDEIGEAEHVSCEKYSEHKHAMDALRDAEEISRLSKTRDDKHDSNAQRYDVRCRDLQSEIHASTSKMESLFAGELTRLSRKKHAQSEAMELLSAKVNDVDAKYESFAIY